MIHIYRNESNLEILSETVQKIDDLKKSICRKNSVASLGIVRNID